MIEIELLHGTLTDSSADTLIINLFQGVTNPQGATASVDRWLDGAITRLIAIGDVTGKVGEVRTFYPHHETPIKRVLLVGLGEREQFTPLVARNAAAHAIRAALAYKAQHVATIVHGLDSEEMSAELAAQTVAEGMLLALDRYPNPKQGREPEHEIGRITVVEEALAKIPQIEQGLAIGRAISQGVALARHLIFTPPNTATPQYIADVARDIAQSHNLQLFIGDRAWARSQQMGAFLGVTAGAGFEPRFIVMEYNAERTEWPAIVLVGKGITFDSGGISIKPAANMELMKADMAGCAAVLGVMQAVSALGLPVRLIAITPCCENMPDAHAYRPSDVLTASNGKTIEIISTDAEGRLILADALVYAQRYQPRLVIDLATLTGTAMRALGLGMGAAMFATDEQAGQRLQQSGTETHERVWPFPLWPEYRQLIDSPVADMKNTGGADGGLASSAVFLQQFIAYPWIHLDIAPMMFTQKRVSQAYEQHGALGFGVRLLVQFLRHFEP